jgi:hypothetical protein
MIALLYFILGRLGLAIQVEDKTQEGRGQGVHARARRPEKPGQSAKGQGRRRRFGEHYLKKPGRLAAIQLERGTLRVGDVIHICGHTTDFRQKVEFLEVDYTPTTEVGPKDDFGLKVVDHAREHDVVFKVRS